MKKTIVFCMNCHGRHIINIINKYKHIILNDYDIIHISYASNNYLTTNIFNDEDINIIKKADILILQYIKNNRNMLNHDYICNNLATTKQIYIFPHYTFNGYFYDENYNIKLLFDCKTKEEIDNTIKNIIFDSKKCLEHVEKSFDYIKELDKLGNGCINIYQFIKDNYKKYRLFQENGHPNNLFFIEVANQLLYKIGYNPLDGLYENTQSSDATLNIIYPQLKDILNLEFEYNITKEQYITINEFFYIVGYPYIFEKNIADKIYELFTNDNKDYKYYNHLDYGPNKYAKWLLFKISGNTLKKILAIIR
jgi:hypothetical protein